MNRIRVKRISKQKTTNWKHFRITNLASDSLCWAVSCDVVLLQHKKIIINSLVINIFFPACVMCIPVLLFLIVIESQPFGLEKFCYSYDLKITIKRDFWHAYSQSWRTDCTILLSYTESMRSVFLSLLKLRVIIESSLSLFSSYFIVACSLSLAIFNTSFTLLVHFIL